MLLVRITQYLTACQAIDTECTTIAYPATICMDSQAAEVTAYWLPWWELSGNLLLWGSERVAQTEYQLEQERMLRQKLAEKLRELGVEPETL